MAKSLIIVESPTKTKTLKSFLGTGYQIEASMGHVRDLPERIMGVDVEHDFAPTYVPIATRRDVLRKLTAAVKSADQVYLASDPDREGEAIAWHLAEALNLKNAKRIEYNEITRQAVETALRNPRSINQERVEAQEARRILDRLVGYKLSPLLWKKVRKNLSAGRVQSVVLRLIVDREREVLAFIPVEYWSITATLTPQLPVKRFPFDAKLVLRGREKVQPANEEEANAILRELDGARYVVDSIKKREQKRNPAAPFITSTLQQEASRKLGFGNRRTMTVAQQLYEGIDLGNAGSTGLITYMRTDSVRIASEAQQEARKYIGEQFGADYLPAAPKQYATKNSIQDAHEAIRPTSVYRSPDSISQHLTAEQLKLYRLIWNRFVASQMQPAVFDVTTADILAGGYTFRATGSVKKFDGFTRVYTEGKDTEEKDDEEREPLPALAKGQPLDLISLLPKQHFTEPPPRYTEATLVKAMSETGIGRPSTYASFIATIQDREYVILDEKKFKPTDLGFTVSDLLVKHFPEIMDIGFTSAMETKLDEVEEGQVDKVGLLREFYGPFDRSVTVAHETMERIKPQQVETEFICPKCGKPMMLRESKFGKFLGCSGYPKCKTVLNEDGSPREERQGQSEHKCPKCGNPMVQRQSTRGEFLGCSGYPKCKTVLNVDGTAREETAKTENLTDQKCPNCGKPLAERQGRFGTFLGCSGYPKCKTIVRVKGEQSKASTNGAAPPEPIGIECPKDGGEIVAKKTRYGSIYVCANEPECDFKTWNRPIGRPCPECGYPLGEASYKGRPTGEIKCSNPDCGHTERAGSTRVTADIA